ncbi:MAG: hypothetical protein AB7F59_08540 [Bdellovibrionales bacterium]
MAGRNTVVIDVTANTRENLAKSDPTLRVVQLQDIFAKPVPFLGFGRPNVYLTIPKLEAPTDTNASVKFAAKSLWRGDAEVVDTRGRVQSGLLVTFPSLRKQAIEDLMEAAKKHEGGRGFTCVNANCKVMETAGFTLGNGQSLTQYNFPIPLLRDLIANGLKYKGEDVEFEIVRTTPGFMEEVGLSIQKAVCMTACRHIEKAITSKTEDNVFLVRIKNAVSNTFGMLIRSGAKAPELESVPVRLEVENRDLEKFDVSVSEPSSFGVLLRYLWGPHSLFEIPLNKAKVENKLPQRLNAFPQQAPNFITKVKKHLLFSETIVGLIRTQLSKGYRHFGGMTEKDLYDMLATHSEVTPNKYNVVVLSDRMIIMKIDIQSSLVDWVLSKHVLLSRYSRDVRFAGEIWKTADGQLYINRNSGTYQPAGSLLPDVTEVMRETFPNIPIVMDEM